MRKLFLILAMLLALCATMASAQKIIKGDMNNDGILDVTDVTEEINTVLHQKIEYINVGGDPFMVDNARVAGTWYKTKTEHFTLSDDGKTDFAGAATYEFLPYQGRLVFLDAKDEPVSWMSVVKLKNGHMWCAPNGQSPLVAYSNTQPIQLVTSIQLSDTATRIQLNETKQITATVLPDDADNKTVTWSSSNENVVKITPEGLHAVGGGTAVITCSANDGSGVKATCSVRVPNIDRSGRDSNGREWVDLDLPGGVLWASWNVGASKPEEFGQFFAWGETKGYAKNESHDFDWSNYKWCNGASNKLTKYCVNSNYGMVDNKTTLEPSDDAATANWGQDWRMPTRQEMKDLYNNAYTTVEIVQVNGIACLKVTSKSNDNFIYLPEAGFKRYDHRYIDEGTSGIYWTSTLHEGEFENSWTAYFLFFYSREHYMNYSNRCEGCSVRAVRTK